MDFEAVNGGVDAQAEAEFQAALAHVTVAALDFTYKSLIACIYVDSGADGISIALGAGEFDLEPVAGLVVQFRTIPEHAGDAGDDVVILIPVGGVGDHKLEKAVVLQVANGNAVAHLKFASIIAVG